MASLQDYLGEYRKQLEKGHIRKAYRGLMEYITGLRSHLANKHPDYFVSGSVNYGFMDFTYFTFFPQSLKKRNLKIVVLFIHDAFTFEAWLSGQNKSIQAEYWKLFKESDWNKYHLAPAQKGVDYILKFTLVDNPDFRDPDALTAQIEKGISTFTGDIEDFLSEH